MNNNERKAAFDILTSKGLGLGHCFPRDTMLYKEPTGNRRTVTPLVTLSPLQSFLVASLWLETATNDLEQKDLDELRKIQGEPDRPDQPEKPEEPASEPT